MKIKSAKTFRTWYKNLTPARTQATQFWDENFIGAQYGDLSGFFSMYHGDKEQVYDFLRKEVEMAEDGQAIYEFVQNAADSSSTQFYMFYDQDYLLVVNNGATFSREGIKSILNIGQSYGKHDPDKIGRYGIGFKLTHRLVGKSSGLDELLNNDAKGYRGPILFSWSTVDQLNSFRSSDHFDYTDFHDNDAPWLLKILITNFPAQPLERVKGVAFEDVEPFPVDELQAFQRFLNEYSQKMDVNSLNSGTIFFIKLGDKKFEYLEKQKQEYLNGLATSMHFLKSLEKLTINNTIITKDREANNTLEFNVPNGSFEFNGIGLTEQRDKESDAKFKICFANNTFSANEIKKHPNIYKYFPAVKEVSNLSFIIHSNLFELSSNRQNLTETPINRNLLSLLAKQLESKMEVCKYQDKSIFESLYLSILMSEKTSNSSGNGWQQEYFYDIMLEYIRRAIPTDNGGFVDNAMSVKINSLNIKLNLSDFGLTHINWFYWSNSEDEQLITEATKHDKLNLEKWDIRDIVENADLNSINNWLKNRKNEDYNKFLEELEKSNLRQKTREKICQIELFRFSDDQYYSFNDCISSRDVYGKTSLNYSNCFFTTSKVTGIKEELIDLGIIVSDYSSVDFPNVFSCITFPDDKRYYELIAEKCKCNELSPQQKKKLFLNFINEETKFDNVAEGTLKDLELFCNHNLEIRPLKSLVANINTPNWLDHYKINSVEHFNDLDDYLIGESELYRKIIFPDVNDLIEGVDDIEEFYEKTIFYYGLEDHNPVFKRDQHKVIYVDGVGFKIFNEILYNAKMKDLGKEYLHFQNAISSLLDFPTPQQSILSHLEQEPFFVQNDLLCDQKHDDCSLDMDDIKALLSFCKLNDEQFFKNFIIKKNGNDIRVEGKTEDTYQVQSSDKKTRDFVDRQCSDNLFVLPYEFLNHKEDDGIIKGDDLHSLILDYVDVDENKEELVEVIRYRSRSKFLESLTEFEFQTDIDYSKDDYEYKILDFAYDALKDNGYKKFQQKVAIDGLMLSNIRPTVDKIQINEHELSLARILPENFGNGDCLSILIDQFVSLGLNKDNLNLLFGVSEEPQLQEVFQLFSENIEVLENAEQLAFLFLYGLHIEEIDFGGFKAHNIHNQEVSLEFDKYLVEYDFIDDEEILHAKYSDVKKLFKGSVFTIDYADDLLLIKRPFFKEGEFICQYLKKNMSDGEKISFIEFLFDQWLNKEGKKNIIRNIDWISISGDKTKDILGFNPNISVYPNEYALEEETLPDYLIDWVEDDDERIDFISDLGIWAVNTVIIDLRKFLKGESDEFNNNLLSQEKRFEVNETILFNTFKWLKVNEIELTTPKQFETFKKIVEVINGYRETKGDLKIEDKFDFEKLAEKSSEWDEQYYLDWTEDNEDSVNIYLYLGELPICFSLNEIDEYVFYRFDNGDLAKLDANTIYLNKDADIKKQLRRLELDDSDFNFEGLWQNKLEVLERKIALLEQKNNATIGVSSVNGLSKNDQLEINREAKEVVKIRLENEGYHFTNGIGSYSTVDGVYKDGIEHPLVIKSYRYQNEPLKIGANEWIQLMKPNSMFWVNFGNGNLGCLKLYDLLRNQDNLTISFSTKNLDVENRLEKFAELLHYFGNVHFNFNSLNSNNYGVAENLGDYRFNERVAEKDLSSDNESIL